MGQAGQGRHRVLRQVKMKRTRIMSLNTRHGRRLLYSGLALVCASVSLYTYGCSKKNPTTTEEQPSITAGNFKDSLYASNNIALQRVCELRITFTYYITNYTRITANSDTAEFRLFFHNHKIIIPSGNYLVSIYGEVDDRYLNNYFKTITNISQSDTSTIGLSITDTLTTVDSANVNVHWWYNGQRYMINRKY
jgi:hypothetical protein